MTDASDASSQDTFISHLIELRTRLLRAVMAVLGIFVVLFIYPGPSMIYDILAQPMLASLPQGTRMIATGVITPFMVPIKVTLLASFVLQPSSGFDRPVHQAGPPRQPWGCTSRRDRIRGRCP
ncbi:Sec-independent protein translocase protein TatC [Castellaniella denitrificans]